MLFKYIFLFKNIHFIFISYLNNCKNKENKIYILLYIFNKKLEFY